jgi:hypothetical protein
VDADAARLAAAAVPTIVPAPAADLVRRTGSAISDAAALAVMQVKWWCTGCCVVHRLLWLAGLLQLSWWCVCQLYMAVFVCSWKGALEVAWSWRSSHGHKCHGELCPLMLRQPQQILCAAWVGGRVVQHMAARCPCVVASL